MASVPTASVAEGRVRAVIDAVLPTVDGGRFPAKRIAGEVVGIEAHCFTDGHDRVRAVLRWKLKDSAGAHIEVDMKAQSNDVWTAEMTPPQPGLYQCTVIAWVDHFESWRREFERREDRSDIRLAVETGAALIDEAAARAAGSDAAILSEWSSQLRDSLKETGAEVTALRALALDPARASDRGGYTDRSLAASATMDLLVDRKRAAFSSWYELFPRSAAALSGLHGKFSDVEARLPYLAEMGFDVLYFPPIHPIGRVNRKGTNNALRAKPGDVGSPWAIGAAEGGHKDILPQLGTFDDFDRLLNVARALGIEIAMDIAFQCAPDHPYVDPAPAMVQTSARRQRAIRRESSEEIPGHLSVRFRKQRLARLLGRTEKRHRLLDRPRRQDISRRQPAHQAVRLLGMADRRDQTRSSRCHFPGRSLYPTEGHASPGQVGLFPVVYVFYVAQHQAGVDRLFHGLEPGPGRQYYRPNVWPNTPDILPETLQSGLRPMYAARLILAATLSANYGIYGPTYELMESAPREAGSEEYRDSEKYQLRHWSLQQPDSLWSLIARMNRIRRENAALQSDGALHFCTIENDQLIAYLKMDASRQCHSHRRQPGSASPAVRLGRSRCRRIEVRSRSALPGA